MGCSTETGFPLQVTRRRFPDVSYPCLSLGHGTSPVPLPPNSSVPGPKTRPTDIFPPLSYGRFDRPGTGWTGLESPPNNELDVIDSGRLPGVVSELYKNTQK